MFDGDDPVPVVVFCVLPVLVPEVVVVEPSEVVVVVPDCAGELEPLVVCPVAGVVDGIVEGVVEVVVAGEPLAGSWSLVVVPEPFGVAPPPARIVEVPPVACDFDLLGSLIVVVEVVTVVGVTADVTGAAGATGVCGRSDGAAATGAASSGGSALEYVTGAAAGGDT